MAITRHKRLDSDTENVIAETFTYDHQNRLLTQTHQVDNNPVEYLAQNKYNELSQLESKKVDGVSLGSGLQTVDYQYNIRGWMTKINDPANLGSDLFGYKINYNVREGYETPNLDFPNLKVKPRFNGNIAEVFWKTSSVENDPLKSYAYSYDELNRLSGGFYQRAGYENAKEYFEINEYDLNGNISRLKRSAGILVGSTTALAIDNLKYDYLGNRLTKVTEEQIGNSNGYPYLTNHNVIEYDNNIANGNGNMTKHLDKGISSIQYNYLNLPQQITQNATVTNYVYRADGVKLKKLFGNLETDYLDGFQYKSTFYVESWNGVGTYIPDPNEIPLLKLRIIPTTEGYYDALIGQYIYNFSDHLGNVRLTYSDSNNDGVIQPRNFLTIECKPKQGCFDVWKPGEIVMVDNYYPFGLLHNYTSTTQNAYQYKYNGKEIQETGMYDYGARFYMPDIGRWGVLDPLAEKHRRHSPYNYAVNNPIMFIDPDGRDIKIGDQVYTYDKNRDYSKYKGFELSTYEALDYLYSTGALNFTTGEGEGAKTVNVMDEMINDKKNTFTINEQTKSGEKNEYDPNTKSVNFNPKEAIRFRKDGTKSTLEEGNVGYNSPSSRLGHEIIHGYNHLFDSKYGERRRNDYSTKSEKSILTPDGANLRFKNEEEFTTTILGNRMNTVLNEDKRTNYGIIPYSVGSVKSIKEVKPPTTPTP